MSERADESHQRLSADNAPDRATGLSDEQIEDLRSHVRGSVPSATGTYDYELGSGWRCFHCGEMFRTWGGASLHFGGPADKRPSCVSVTEPQAAPNREFIAKAICCPKGCVAKGDCQADKRRDERSAVDAVLSALSRPHHSTGE